jgi:hypothetical protein
MSGDYFETQAYRARRRKYALVKCQLTREAPVTPVLNEKIAPSGDRSPLPKLNRIVRRGNEWLRANARYRLRLKKALALCSNIIQRFRSLVGPTNVESSAHVLVNLYMNHLESRRLGVVEGKLGRTRPLMIRSCDHPRRLSSSFVMPGGRLSCMERSTMPTNVGGDGASASNVERTLGGSGAIGAQGRRLCSAALAPWATNYVRSGGNAGLVVLS